MVAQFGKARPINNRSRERFFTELNLRKKKFVDANFTSLE